MTDSDPQDAAASVPDVTLYGTAICPYCMMAKRLLHNKGIEFKEIRVDQHPLLRREMTERSRRYTVPQIFIGNRHIGGFDDLYALDRVGALEELLHTTGGEPGP